MPVPGGVCSIVLGLRSRVGALGERGEGFVLLGCLQHSEDSPLGEEQPVPSEEGMKSPLLTSFPQPVWSGPGSDPSQETPGLSLTLVLHPRALCSLKTRH